MARIVVLDDKGRSNFHDLIARRGETRYYAFDLMWLNSIDLRSRPLLDRKRRLHRLIPPNDSHLLYVEHLEGDGARFFELVCEQDLEGIICKPRPAVIRLPGSRSKTPTTRRLSDARNGLIACCRNDSTNIVRHNPPPSLITVCRGLDIAGLDGIIIRRRHIDVDVAIIGFWSHITGVVIR
jgi:hypothetical protein